MYRFITLSVLSIQRAKYTNCVDILSFPFRTCHPVTYGPSTYTPDRKSLRVDILFPYCLQNLQKPNGLEHKMLWKMQVIPVLDMFKR